MSSVSTLVEEKVFMLYGRLSDRGSIPGLIHRTSGKGFSPRFVSRLLHTPTLTRAELSARLVSARIPHIRGEVVTANFRELRNGEVRRMRGLRGWCTTRGRGREHPKGKGVPGYCPAPFTS